MLLFLEVFPQKSSINPEAISISIKNVLISSLQRKLKLLNLLAM